MYICVCVGNQQLWIELTVSNGWCTESKTVKFNWIWTLSHCHMCMPGTKNPCRNICDMRFNSHLSSSSSSLYRMSVWALWPLIGRTFTDKLIELFYQLMWLLHRIVLIVILDEWPMHALATDIYFADFENVRSSSTASRYNIYSTCPLTCINETIIRLTLHIFALMWSKSNFRKIDTSRF